MRIRRVHASFQSVGEGRGGGCGVLCPAADACPLARAPNRCRADRDAAEAAVAGERGAQGRDTGPQGTRRARTPAELATRTCTNMRAPVAVWALRTPCIHGGCWAVQATALGASGQRACVRSEPRHAQAANRRVFDEMMSKQVRAPSPLPPLHRPLISVPPARRAAFCADPCDARRPSRLRRAKKSTSSRPPASSRTAPR